MAVLKHISSKSSNYGFAIDYLQFKHNELSDTPILDENGNMIPRDEFYLEGINCDPYTFAIECRELNREWGKNQDKNDIKSHHYIISFDPRDKQEGRLDGEKAQELGMEFAKKYFDGHQCLVCTHTDGTNESGNIHVHIILNSLRKYTIEPKEWTERPGDCLAGHKHHLTDEHLKFLKGELMKICQRESLNQIDLLSPSDKKITDKEYKAKRRQEMKRESGNNPELGKTITEKDVLRQQIDDILSTAKNMDEFTKGLSEKYHIDVTQSRGRMRYKGYGKDKALTEKSLGIRYSQDSLEKIFSENLSKERDIFGNIWDPTLGPMRNDNHHKVHKYDKNYDYTKDPVGILYIESKSDLINQIQDIEKDKLSRANDQDAELNMLSQMVQTISWVESRGYNTYQEVADVYKSSQEKSKSADNELAKTKSELQKVNEEIHYYGMYLVNRDLYKEFLSSKDKGTFRKAHEKEINNYEEGRNWMREKYGNQQWPSFNSLQERKYELTAQRNKNDKSCKYYKSQESDLNVISSNIRNIFNRQTGKAGTRVQEQNKNVSHETFEKGGQNDTRGR